MSSRNTPFSTVRAAARRPSGFTLVELMVVVTILAVLIGMAVPRFVRAVEQSRADIAAANLRAIWGAERLYWLENHAYTDQLSQQTPQGLVELGLLDPAVASASGDYVYRITAAGSDTFQAEATRTGSAFWAGTLTIDQTGTTGGSISAAGETAITPGFQ
ncbi:MAG: prepilin-type N-terminal cleavage/methylation domain-containing protein [Thermoguttaceae bacterium]|jgi:general secretion pathway protein G